MNFNNLPCDIKQMIYEQNRSWTAQQISNNKTKYNEVINDFNDRITDVYWWNYREDEPDTDFDFPYTYFNECVFIDN